MKGMNICVRKRRKESCVYLNGKDAPSGESGVLDVFVAHESLEEED